MLDPGSAVFCLTLLTIHQHVKGMNHQAEAALVEVVGFSDTVKEHTELHEVVIYAPCFYAPL